MKTSTIAAPVSSDHVTRVYLRLTPSQQFVFTERLRKDRSIKIKDVAINANVSRTTLYNIIKGYKLVAREKIVAIAERLNIDPLEIFPD